jgi:hypothetical protein
MELVGARTARRLLIALAALLVLLVVADRVGVVIAERAAGDTIETSQHLASRPDVDIAGFPFLTQLATGHYDKITVTAHDVPIGRGDAVLTISSLTVVLHSLTVARDFSRLHAKTATATARISYAELIQRLGLQLRYAGGGSVVASKTITIAGRSITGTVRARPRLAAGALSFDAVSVDNAGALGELAATALGHVFDVALALQGIPFKVQVQDLHAAPDGVILTLAGEDLSYAN